MDKREDYKRMVKLLRKQGKSAKEARELAGEAIRCMQQGKAWQERANRKADKQKAFISRGIIETVDGIDKVILPAKGTRRTYKNGCRIASNAKTTANRLVFDILTRSAGNSLAVYSAQDSTALAAHKQPATVYRFIDKTASGRYVVRYEQAWTRKQARHLRRLQQVAAHRYAKRQALRAMLYAMRSMPDRQSIVWHVQDWSVEYPAQQYPMIAKIAAYNAGLTCQVKYNHAAFMALNTPEKD